MTLAVVKIICRAGSLTLLHLYITTMMMMTAYSMAYSVEGKDALGTLAMKLM